MGHSGAHSFARAQGGWFTLIPSMCIYLLTASIVFVLIQGLTECINLNSIPSANLAEYSTFPGLSPMGTRKGGRHSMADLRKSDIAAQVAGKLGGSKVEGERALNAVLGAIHESLADGNKVVLTGFGSFSVREVKARKVKPIRGGQAGQLITVPAHKRVGFTAGADLNKAAQG